MYVFMKFLWIICNVSSMLFWMCREMVLSFFCGSVMLYTKGVYGMGWPDQRGHPPDPSIINRVGSNSWVQSDWKKSNPSTSGYNNKIKSYAHCVLCCPPSRVCNNKLMRHALDCKGLHNLYITFYFL